MKKTRSVCYLDPDNVRTGEENAVRLAVAGLRELVQRDRRGGRNG